jgi:spore coat protein U-like protein
MVMRTKVRGWLAAVAFVLVGSSPALSSAQTFAVSADVVPGCALFTSNTTSGIDFGTLAFGTHPATNSGTVTAAVVATGGGAMEVECTQGLSVQVTVDGGQHASGSQRRLALASSPTNLVSYALFTSPSMATPIPVGSSVSVAVPPTGVLALPLFGAAVLPGSGLMPGAYTDTVHVTLSW